VHERPFLNPTSFRNSNTSRSRPDAFCSAGSAPRGAAGPYGSSGEFADHGDYSAGDNYRYLDWNIYARMGQLLVKLFEEEQDLHVYILLDAVLRHIDLARLLPARAHPRQLATKKTQAAGPAQETALKQTQAEHCQPECCGTHRPRLWPVARSGQTTHWRHAVLPGSTSLYPAARTLSRIRGSAGSTSIFLRSDTM